MKTTIFKTQSGTCKYEGDIVYIIPYLANCNLSNHIEKCTVKPNVSYFGMYFDTEKEATTYNNANMFLNKLPSDFNTKVLALSESQGMDSALYMLIGKYLPEIDENDYDLVENLVELIVEKWNELEF